MSAEREALLQQLQQAPTKQAVELIEQKLKVLDKHGKGSGTS
jgi:hypothetical protein